MSPSYVRLSRAQAEAVLVAALRKADGEDAELLEWTASPASKRGRQRTLRYDVRARRRGSVEVRDYHWVGKFYDRDDVARSVAATLRQLGSRSGVEKIGSLVVPRVVAYHPSFRLLLLTFEAGGSLVAAIAEESPSVLTTLARAIADLHATPVALNRVTSAADVLARLQRDVADLSARFPRHATLLRDTQLRLERRPPLDHGAPAFLHGDLGPAQLRFRMGNIVMLDFDDCTRGDPALDLGNLLTQLRRLTLRKPRKLPDFATLRGAILDAYKRTRPNDPGLIERVNWYEEAALVRKIHFLAFDKHRHSDSETLLQRRAEAIRLLGDLPLGMKSNGSAAISSRGRTGFDLARWLKNRLEVFRRTVFARWRRAWRPFQR
jgi:aminoglycoside phosphotransferase (APT) family kinase protein